MNGQNDLMKTLRLHVESSAVQSEIDLLRAHIERVSSQDPLNGIIVEFNGDPVKMAAEILKLRDGMEKSC